MVSGSIDAAKKSLKTTIPQEGLVHVSNPCQNLIKSNLLHIDGNDLSNCRLIEMHPEPFTVRTGGLRNTTINALTHTDHRTDQFSKYLKEIIFRLYPFCNHQNGSKIKITMMDTLWYQVKDAFRFSLDNLYNQFEDVTHVLLTMCLREIDTSVICGDGKLPLVFGLETIYAVTEEYHAKLFDNYTKWSDYMGIHPFPWGDDKNEFPWRKNGNNNDMAQMVTEIILFKLIWGEASNLRHTPELLCFLFHWGATVWRTSRTNGPINGDFIDVVSVIVQRIMDEAWYGSKKLKPPDHSSRLTYDDFNELFWEAASLKWLHLTLKSSDPRLAPQTTQALIDSLTKSKIPGKSVKTFVERRSYAQVLRAFIRVFHWHYFTFQLLFWARSSWDDNSIDTRQREFGQAIFSAIVLSVIQPALELSLFDLRSLKKCTIWMSLLKLNMINVLRIGFFCLAIFALISDTAKGFSSNHFQYNGIVGFPYLVFYGAHAVWPFLHIRCFGAMPLFAAIWHIPGLRWVVGPSTFTGGTAMLAEDFTHVIHYAIFWILPLFAKFAFWFFGVLPNATRVAQFLSMVEFRPLYFYCFAIIKDDTNIFLRFVYWIPIFTLWFYDTQIFLLLFGSLYSTLIGYLRRVGFVQDVTTIQKRLLPLLTAKPLFCQGVGAMSVQDEGGEKKPKTFDKSGQQSVSQRMKRSTSYSTTGLRTPRQGLVASTPASNRGQRAGRVEYTNNSDPYAKMFQNLNACAIARSHQLTLVGPIGEASRYRKCFGFVWNEICNTWRLEDILSNEEVSKLQFNEFPAFYSETLNKATSTSSCSQLGLNQWSELRSHGLNAVWDRSIARLPVYVYSDLILSFLKACENYQLQLDDDDSMRIRSRKNIASRFFKKYLSIDPNDQLTTNMRSALPMEGLREVIEAFFMYLSRYFASGSVAVEAMEQLWNWICNQPSRLKMFDLMVLRELRTHMIQLFTTAQSTKDTFSSESARKRIEATHKTIKRCLTRLVMPDVAKTPNPPSEIKGYLTAIELSFSSSFSLPPWCEPPSLDLAELNGLMIKLQQVNLVDVAPSTTLIDIYGCEEVFQPYLSPTLTTSTGSFVDKDKVPSLPTLKRELVAELRTLFRLNSGAFLPRDVDGVLKLYFRRAARILTVSEARLASPEGQRRLKFFTNSLLMKMPAPPEIVQMVSMCTLTPYYREECLSDLNDLHRTTQDGVAKIELLRSLMPQEFANFLERVDRDREIFRLHQDFESSFQNGTTKRHHAFKEFGAQLEKQEQLFHYIQFCRQLQRWASDRSQVLSRTVRGIMYYETALQVLNFIECRSYEQLHLCHDLNRLSFDQNYRLGCPEAGLWRDVLQLPPPYLFTPSVKALARIKFHYVVAAQEFGRDLRIPIPQVGTLPTHRQRAALMRKNAVIDMLRRYPSLRVATLEDELDSNGGRTGRKFSVLYRWSPKLYTGYSKSCCNSTSECLIGKPELFSTKEKSEQLDGENDSQTTASETEETKRKTWFQTEPRQMMSPPRRVTTEDIPWSNLSLMHNNTSLYSSSPHQMVTPVRVLKGKGQSPLRLRYSSMPNPHGLSGIFTGFRRSETATPGSLEDCRSPEQSGGAGDTQPPNQVFSEESFPSQRHKFGNITCPTPPRYSPIFGSRVAKTSIEPSVENFDSPPWQRQEKEAIDLSDTPLVGRDNDLLLEAYPKNETYEEELHSAPLTSDSGGLPEIQGRKGIQTVLDGELVVIYKILLPTIKDEFGRTFERNPIIGPGKPENQNHAMIFTRGETVQAIDMNMESYLEEALKLRNLLQEFTANPRMRILGFREHIFSLDVSSISSYMALQESSFVTINQRLYHKPLCIKMHYGHPDVFDRFFVHCCGSMSKSSNGVNLSEDVFAGYNATQRGFTVHHVDYLQVGKGRDVGLQQISMFEKKVASGNAEQMLSRDLRRMLDNMDFFRMMSLFYSGPGFLFNSLILMLGVFLLLYERAFFSFARQTSTTPIGSYWNELLAPVTNIQFQLGMLLIIPIILLTALEKGLMKVGTKAAAIDSVLVYGGAQYQETGRGFQISHNTLQMMWRIYYFTHFQIAIEILLLLCLYAVYGGLTIGVYILDTWPLWILFSSLTWTPFIFNPLGAYYTRVLDDLKDFVRWINAQDLQSIESSWRAWWRSEMDYRAEIWWHNKALVFVRLLRFIALSFGLVMVVAHHYNYSDIDTFIYLVSSFLSIGVLILFMNEFKLINPNLNKFLGFMVVIVVIGGLLWAICIGVLPLSVLLSSSASFAVLVYGLTRLALVVTGRAGVRHPLLELSMRIFHISFAYVVFFPVVVIASITTSFHLIQTRVLFNSRFVGIVDTGLIKKAEAEKKGQ